MSVHCRNCPVSHNKQTIKRKKRENNAANISRKVTVYVYLLLVAQGCHELNSYVGDKIPYHHLSGRRVNLINADVVNIYEQLK